MTLKEFEKAMIDHGMERKDVADALGMSTVLLGKKMRGETDWWVHEVRSLSQMLDLDVQLVNDIFFDGKLPKNNKNIPTSENEDEMNRFADMIAYKVVKELDGNDCFHG